MPKRSSSLNYSVVPKTRELNLAFRKFIINEARDPRKRAVIYEACKNGVDGCLFYINTFCWLYEPREYPNCIPFITYEFQDKLIRTLVGNLALSLKTNNKKRYDVLVEKSRTMGVTWVCLVVLDWFWRFGSGVHFRAISRVEGMVDTLGDMDALFPKLDYIEERLPRFLQVRGAKHDRTCGRSILRINNPKNRSAIVGESSNPNAGRAGRNTAILRDEEAFAENGKAITKACRDTTRMMIRISTPNGMANSFFVAKSRGKCTVVTLHWTQHPVYAEGLYSVQGGDINVIDKAWHEEYKKKHGKYYEFKIGPTHSDPGVPWEFLRSPWFDEQEDTADSPLDIAQELQISYLGSGKPYFDLSALSSLRVRHGRQAHESGSIEKLLGIDFQKLGITDRDQRPNRCRIWYEKLKDNGTPPGNTTYTIGVDVAAGSGSSDSVVSIADDVSKRKVLEFWSNGITPTHMAVLVHEMYERFITDAGKPFLAWDMGGHGMSFGMQIMLYGDMHVFYYKTKDERKNKKAQKPGYPSNGKIKEHAFGQYRNYLFNGPYITPSHDEYAQAEQFVYDGRGGVVHSKAKEADDPSSAGDQHGDIVTASVIMVVAMMERPNPIKVERYIPPNCLYSKMKKWKKEDKAKQSMWVA